MHYPQEVFYLTGSIISKMLLIALLTYISRIFVKGSFSKLPVKYWSFMMSIPLISSLIIYLIFEADNKNGNTHVNSMFAAVLVVVKELHNRHDYEYLREIYKLIIEYLKDNYIQIDFSIIPINLDVFPFINENFIPEVRYTYIMDLTMSIEKIFLKMSSNRRRDYKKSFKENFIININNADLEISKILFWVNDSYLKNRLEEEMKLLIDKKKGALLNIYNKNYGIIGQLFLCWDWKCAYVQNVYVDKEYAKFGISTRLYIEAILYAKEILKVKKFDFNGSVLAGVENYYRTFGGEQQLYFNLHWMENHSELLKVDYYDYR